MSNPNKLKKFALSFVLSIFSLVTILGAIFLAPAPAQAQWGVATLTDAPRMLSELGTKVQESFKQVVMTSAIKGLSYFMRKIAYDSAVWLASGGKGQSPFAHTTSFGNYMEQVAGDAAAEAIDTMGRTWGLDLCRIPNIQLDLALRIGMRQRYGDDVTREGRCSFQEMQAGWSSETYNSMYGSDQIANRFNATLSADMDSDLGVYLKSNSRLDEWVSTKSEAKKAEREEGKGFLPLAGMINGDVKTPAAVMEEGFKQNTPDKAQAKSESEINAVLASGAYQVIPATLSTFLNTLTSQMLKNFTENGMLPFGICGDGLGGSTCDNTDVAVFEGSGSTVFGRDAAQAAFSEFLVAKPTVLDKYDLVPQLGACPDAPGIYNCRIDSDFAEVIKTENFDRPLTIEEALASKKLHGDWKLIPPTNALDSDKNCFEKNAYCYSNIRVLRQTRILPLGFEIAAKNSDPDHPWSLGDVVKGFYDCNYQIDSANNIVGVNYDPINKPYCHLIDPRWVLKSPPARCNALASGSSLMMEEAPTRLDECVDLSTCVAYNKDGSCLSYGYCAREKNTWRFEADKCDSYNATCKAFTDANGSQVAYLYRTLDTGSCNQNTAGCRAYSLEQSGAGAWQEPKLNADSPYFNTGIHFNNKLASPCFAPGCSAFNVETPNGNDQRYLKKAPDYLQCYDADPATPLEVNIPKTNADLAKIKPRPECSQYAGVCIPTEIGCNWFTSILNQEAIPGKFKPAEVVNSQVVHWNDQCDARCDGYAAYKEMFSNYSNGQELAYVIPPNSTNNAGATCQPQEESCTSFTNMGESFAGGEKIEYYTYLRPCIKPDTDKQKNFYTYEGADGAIGYQLKSYTLEKDTELGSNLGGPKYWARTNAEKIQYDDECTADRYKKGLASADCRQFSDDQGNVYYRLLRQVVVVNNSCTNYRLNSSEFASSTPDPATNKYTCFQNGEYREGFCYYFGLPSGIATTAGQSHECAKEAESCRAYKGNAANRVRNVFDTLTFEDTTKATEGWSAVGGSIALSSESTQVKGHSLNHSDAGNLEKNFDVKLGKSYVLSFWAKGNQQGIGVKIKTDQTNDVGTINVSDVWQYYTLTSKDVSGGTASGTLQFISGSNNAGSATLQLYIDNINLKEITDYIYLVKNSLKVDPICDSVQNDNLPGEALGCTGYNDPNNNPFYLTNFSYLCREGAIGCAKMFDTYNTPDDAKAMAYNVWLTVLPIGSASGQKLSVKIDNDTFTCQVAVGETGCYTNIKGYTKAEIEVAVSVPVAVGTEASFTTSTAYVPPDSTDDPLYLVINQNSVCTVADQGCTMAGLVTETPMGPKYVTTTIKNDPSTYDQTICSSEAVGCNSYSVGQGSYYFKDPAVTGQKVCAYNNKATVNGQVASGWFWKDVGQCAGTTTPNISNTLVSGQKECTKTEDCTNKTETCQNIGVIPCYPTYIQSGNDYGLWSYGDKASGKYDNFVGQCPTEQSSCTEYLDRNDKKTENDKGRSYFFLDNDKINSGDCSGLASLKYGCVLFDQTDKPGKLWNTVATYQKSDGADGKKIEPIKNPDATTNDANTIIKVNADRECGEWLACQDTQRVWDDKRGTYKNICTSVGRCNQKPETAAQENIYNCANFMSDQENLYANKVLTEGMYIGRKVTWNYQDFSGYSILNSYPPEELEQVNISIYEPDWRLVKLIPCGTGSSCMPNMPTSSPNCKYKIGMTEATCGFGASGVCKNGFCVQNIDGTINLNGSATSTKNIPAPKPICRAYPEKTSPFPNIQTLRLSNSFNSANVCNEILGPIPNGDASSTVAYTCDCDYTKVEYGESGLMTKYFNYKIPNNSPIERKRKVYSFEPDDSVYAQDIIGALAGVVPPGICQGGSYNGNSCASNSECMETTTSTIGGVCQLKKKVNEYLGWRGYCLESDISRTLFADSSQHPCLTWLPLDRLLGVPDIYNQYKDAGFVANIGSNYCLQVEKYSKPAIINKCWNPNGPDEGYDHKKEVFCQPDYDSNYAESQCPSGYTPYLYTGDGDGSEDGIIDGLTTGYPFANCWYYDNKTSSNCGVVCMPNDDIKDKWILNWPHAAKETTIGCAASLSVNSDNVTAWTNRIFEPSNYQIDSKLSFAQGSFYDSFQYKYNSPQAPFASKYDDPLNGALSSVNYCFLNINDAVSIVPPLWDGTCKSPAYAPTNGYTFAPNHLTYDPTWDFGPIPKNECETDGDCNDVVVGECNFSDVKTALNCGKTCETYADCAVKAKYIGVPELSGTYFGTCGSNYYCTDAVYVTKSQVDFLNINNFSYKEDLCGGFKGDLINVGYCNGLGLRCLVDTDCTQAAGVCSRDGDGTSSYSCVKKCVMDTDCQGNYTGVKTEDKEYNLGKCKDGICSIGAFYYLVGDVPMEEGNACTVTNLGQGFTYTGKCSNMKDKVCGQNSECNGEGVAGFKKCELDGVKKVCKAFGYQNQSSNSDTVDYVKNITDAFVILKNIFTMISIDDIMLYFADSLLDPAILDKGYDGINNYKQIDLNINKLVEKDFNTTESETSIAKAPQVRAVGECNSDLSKCLMEKEGITINDKWDENAKI
ncbi:MAG: hypothetical protein Q7S24_01695, partial [bacterium]|nr:hypothetical protein [bacterium]